MVVLKKTKSIDQSNLAKRNLWNDILADVSQKLNRKLPQNNHILVLGDDESGKTTLFNKMRPEDTQVIKGGGLEYTYLEVREDEVSEEMAKLGVWILDGDPKHQNLMKFALNENSLVSNNLSLVAIVIDLSKPWNCIYSLNNWLNCLSNHVSNTKINQKQRRELENKFRNNLIKFKEDLKVEKTFSSKEIEDIVCSIGIPIIVICTKSDCMNDKSFLNRYTMEHYDFIQMHLRSICFEYGASLIYTSSKDESNFSLLNSYLMYVTYGLKFNIEVNSVDSSKIFIPIGWDSLEKINLLKESIDLDDSINSLPAPSDKNNEPSIENLAEDDDIFVQNLIAQMEKDSSNINSGKADTSASRLQNKPQLTTSSPSSEGVLASFFNNLLTMNSSGSVPPSPLVNLSNSRSANNNSKIGDLSFNEKN